MQNFSKHRADCVCAYVYLFQEKLWYVLIIKNVLTTHPSNSTNMR